MTHGTATPRSRKLARALAGALALLAVNAEAQVDPLQLRLLTQFEQPLRWDNVEPGGPYWEKSAQPTWRKDRSYHAIRLEPGQRVLVKVPPWETLRLHDPSGAALPEELSVSLSSGTGLHVAQRPRRSRDGRDWLVEARAGEPQLARVVLAPGAPRSVDVALFVSRHEPLGIVAPYRHPVRLPRPSVKLRRAVEAAGQAHWLLDRGRPTEIAVNGPARYALRSRLRYPANESALSQTWRIEARLDGAPWAVLEAEAGAESAYPVFVDGQETLVTREDEHYLDIPPGRHRLTLESSGPIVVRMLAQKENDYLFPALNEPEPPARSVRAALREEAPPHLRMSGWGDSGAEAASIVAGPDTPAETVLDAARRLAQDNRMRDSGLIAAAAAQEAAARRRDAPELRATAKELAGLHTYFRDLLPRDNTGAGSLRFAWYLTPELRDIGKNGWGRVAAGQHESAWLSRVASGIFVPLPGSGAAQMYDLPERFAPSILRIALHRASAEAAEELYLQFDEEPPLSLSHSAFPELPADRFDLSTGEIALRLQQARGDHEGLGTLSGAFSRRRVPAPLIRAGVVEVPLPPSVRQVRLWHQAMPGKVALPVWASVKVRNSRPYQLSEGAYFDATRAVRREPGEDAALPPGFLAALAASPADAGDPAGQRLDSHWQPLARLLRAQAKRFGAAIAQADAAPEPPGKPAAAAIAEASRLAARGQWLAAIEAWSKAAASPLPEEREQAFRGRVEALRQLGETFLAEQLLKERMLRGDSIEARIHAREELADLYRREGDRDALQAVYAAALFHDPEIDTAVVVTGLSEALLDNGEASLALAAGLLLPPAQRPVETMLRAAFEQEWWQVFDDLVAQPPDPERRHFWLAHRALDQGREDAALADFQRAGAEGEAFAAHMARARTLRAALDRPPEAALLTEWAQWLATHPGRRTWQDAAARVSDFAGTQSLYSIDRDLYFTAFRSEPGRPVRLRLAGPVRLRIEARPLHPAGSAGRIDGWLRVRSGKREWHTPITQNAPTAGLELVGRPELQAGRRVIEELELGPGWHEVEAGGDLPLLLRAEVEEPALRLPLLPPLTPDMVSFPRVEVSTETAPFYRAWLGGCPDCALLLEPAPGTPPSYERIARTLLTANPAALEGASALPDWPVAPPPENEASLRAGDRWRELLAWPAERSDAALLERVKSLVWVAEHRPKQFATALALAEAIHAAHPEVPGLAALVDRLARSSGWAPVDIVHASAGLRSREIAGWEPESPALRVRRALLPPTAPDERLLAGGNRLVAAFTNNRRARVTLNLASDDVAALPPQPMTALVQIDESPPRRIRLAPGERGEALTLGIPAGRHSLRVWIEDPVANQFLRVRLREAGRSQFAETVERFYHVATAREPVRFRVPGPAWVRIDEWTEGRTETRHRWIAADWEEIVLTPEEGRREALYRIHLRTPEPGRPVTPPRHLEPEPTPLPAPPVVLTGRPVPDTVTLSDGLGLGGQEDGTWSVGAAWRERLYGRDSSPAIEGVPTEDIPTERFLELSATHRHFDPERNAYLRADLLGRLRERGGPTLGLQGEASFHPPWSTWNFIAEAAAFAQAPDDASSTAWSWRLRGTALQRRHLDPLLWHEPRISVFLRDSSVERSRFFRTGELDQDVFTPYRAEHRHGVEVGDVLTWRPWLDTELYGGASLTSNEDFNVFRPDNLGATAGWRQLLGALRLTAQWRGTRYLPDEDRDKAATRSSLTLDLGWERWLPKQERIEAGVILRREIDVQENLVAVYFNWHFGNGRAYRDFRPAEIDFLDLRRHRVPSGPNNRIID